jgi:NAD(P)-dependent dehydrogenase (short-subunit alcohol dehydrogenase family)
MLTGSFSMAAFAPHPSLKDRTVLITGGGRGLGRVMALALVDAGARVFITGGRSEKELAATIAAGRALERGSIAGMLADVADPAACARAVAAALAEFGSVDMLVNNAARGPAEQRPADAPQSNLPFWELSHAAIERLLLTNVAGAWAMTAAVLPQMIARGFGRIVNISTSRPTMVFPNGGIYGPCKAALEASSLIWARQLDGTGVTVNVLLPGGPSDTALIPGEVGGRAVPFHAGKDAPGREGFVEGLLPPEIMAPPILWLASDASNGTTGARFVARDWDPDLAPDEASTRARAASVEWPHII